MGISASVALLIDPATSWGSGLIEGVHRYASTKVDWSLHFDPVGKYEPYRLPSGWRGDGVIARVHSADIAEHLIGAGVPAVNVSWFRHGGGKIPSCTTDIEATGRLCAEYLMDLGLLHFGYAGSQWREGWHDVFGESFIRRLEDAGHACPVFAYSFRDCGDRRWEQEMARLGTWLCELPKPVGLLAMDALRAREVAEICRLHGLKVPQEVAVLAGDYDELCCLLSRPPLSSVDISARRVGFEAAALLARMMAGERVGAEWPCVAPGRITTRQSTDILAIEDHELAKAIRFIRERACTSIQVKDVLKTVAMSRRTLEQRCREMLGRTPAEEIRHIRVEMARRMLEDSDLPIGQIASRCGFEHAELLTRAFRRERGETPSSYRRRVRRPVGLD